jgi:predicted RNase H-like HicB family nuclease
MTVDEYLAIPYVLTMESVRRADGEWVRRASYPELPDCVAESWSPVEALDELDEMRQRRILELIDRGEPVPVPRPPLRSAPVGPDPDRLGFARWLRDQGRLSEA